MTISTLWGGRFKKPLDPLTVQFNASISFDKALAYWDLQGSIAHAIMLGKQGILSQEETNKIVSGLEVLSQKLTKNALSFTEEYEDIHMNIEVALFQEIGAVSKKLHTGRSRNDQVALDLRLYLRHEIKEIVNLLNLFLDTLKLLAQNHSQTLCPGYTHLQKAQPLTLNLYFLAYHNMFQRDSERFLEGSKRMNYSPLGAGALAGSSLPLDRQFVATYLNFDGIIENSLDAVSDRDFIIEFLSHCSILMMHFSRISEDMIIWSTEEFGFVTLDDAFATGSSLMPNKKNPDIPELIRGKSGRVFGHLMGLLTVMKALPLSYNKDMQEDKEGLFDTVTTIKNCLNIISPFLKSLTFNSKKMRESAQKSYIGATKILENLVLQGVAFRDAHEIVGKFVLYCQENGKFFDAINLKECEIFSPFLYEALRSFLCTTLK